METSFKKDHGIQDKKMILGVASMWNERKGFDDFIELARILEEKKTAGEADYKVVLIGLNDEQIADLDKKNSGILALPRTSSQKEMVEAYSAADVFVNPTYEDTFPTVNMEAEGCGTPVITYDTGGCRETLKSEKSMVIPQSVDSIVKALGEMDI